MRLTCNRARPTPQQQPSPHSHNNNGRGTTLVFKWQHLWPTPDQDAQSTTKLDSKAADASLRSDASSVGVANLNGASRDGKQDAAVLHNILPHSKTISHTWGLCKEAIGKASKQVESWLRIYAHTTMQHAAPATVCKRAEAKSGGAKPSPHEPHAYGATIQYIAISGASQPENTQFMSHDPNARQKKLSAVANLPSTSPQAGKHAGASATGCCAAARATLGGTSCTARHGQLVRKREAGVDRCCDRCYMIRRLLIQIDPTQSRD